MRKGMAWATAFLALPIGMASAGCGSGPGEPESKMTSYTSSESETAELFTVPNEQMVHLEVASV